MGSGMAGLDAGATFRITMKVRGESTTWLDVTWIAP